jgi:hypothetical protein
MCYNEPSQKEEACLLGTHPSDQIQTKMAFDISSEIFWETLNQAFFIDPSGVQPLVLVVTSDSFP